MSSEQYRYNYSGSFVDPERHHFGAGDWLSEKECRQVAASLLRDNSVRPESIHIIVQERRNKRWCSHEHGPVKAIFSLNQSRGVTRGFAVSRPAAALYSCSSCGGCHFDFIVQRKRATQECAPSRCTFPRAQA